MNKVLKIISLLLSYPSKELLQEMSSIIDELGTTCLATPHKVRLAKLAGEMVASGLYNAQERYVYLFDRTRTLSLHLFEHVHGESRDRGQAMVDLKHMYEAEDLEIIENELPDYLPMFLEFLSTQPDERASELLGQIKHILVAMHERLRKRKSVYANAFEVLVSLASGKADSKLVEELLGRDDDDPDDLEALDRIWEEEMVTFGGNAGENSCGPDRLRMQMRAAGRRPNSSETQPA